MQNKSAKPRLAPTTENTKFNLARNIVTGDFNGDGIDDLFFVQTGVENHPLIPHPNKVMISSPDGYKVTTLPGPKSWWHGGAVGDIDNDGDIDLVATPNKVNGEPTVYINDGSGKFKYRNLNLRNIRGMPKNYSLQHHWHNVRYPRSRARSPDLLPR